MRLPSEISVDPHTMSYTELRQQSISCPGTSLFSKAAQLNKITELALEGYDSRASFAYSSIGCSFGAELDSTAALLTNQGVSRAQISGVDIDATTLKAAESGQYVDPHYIPVVHGLRNKRLRNLGFNTTSNGPGALAIDASAIRCQHDVMFYQVNLAEDSFSAVQQNLITCHNVLPHVAEDSPKNAKAMAARLCALVATGGILSIASDSGWFNYSYEDKEHAEEVPSYSYLHGRMVHTMQSRYRMEVALRDEQGHVTALRKVQ